MPMTKSSFGWDEKKDKENQAKHGVSFSLAQYAFLDAHRIIVEDVNHSTEEAVLLYWPCRWRHNDREIYIPR
jgi:uncharacterized DUF497 family protein